jgi:cell wall-associated NlpC family hydrolase
MCLGYGRRVIHALFFAFAALGTLPVNHDVGPDARCREVRPAFELRSLSEPLGSPWHLDTPLWLAWHWRPVTMAVVPRSTPPAPEELVRSAREYLGVPYVWGGLSESGFDCSGFVNKVYALNGYDLPRTSREQYKIGSDVSRGGLSTGDLLFFVQNPGEERISHVAMYVADNEFIHDSTGKNQVAYDRLTGYYAKRFYGARRILTLPPGVYSNNNGSARPPGSASSVQTPTPDEPTIAQIIQNADKPPPDGTGTTQPSGEGQIIENIITEHAEGERPPQLMGTFAKGATTHVGPKLLRAEATTVGLQMGIGGVTGTATALAAPEFTYFGHDNALTVSVAAPFQVPLEKTGLSVGETLKQSWDEPKEYLKILQEVRYGQKESELYIDLNRTASATLGHGQLMRYYTPNVESRSVPDYVLTTDALSLSADGVLSWGGGETFIDDLVRPNVVGALAYVRPATLLGSEDKLWRSISLGVTWAGDLRAPYESAAAGGYTKKSVHGLSLDTEIKPYKTDNVDLKTYVAGSTLLGPDTAGAGGALGALLRANINGRITHVVRFRLEGQLSSSTFIPSYFDTTYRLNRSQAPVDQVGDSPITKLALLRELEHTPNRWGIYAEASYQMHRRVSIMTTYEDGGALGSLPPSERYVGRNLQLVFQVNDIYLPQSSRSISFYLAYQLHNFKKLLPLFIDRRPNEYLFAALTFQAWRYLGFSAALRKGYNPLGPAKAAVDGVVNMVASYEI